jgi:Zn-finger protein
MIMNDYNYFENRECKYYSECHGGADKNCLFCFCPLYHYDDCLGMPASTKNNIKDCQNFVFPHKRENYDKIIAFLQNKNAANRGSQK